MYTPAKRILTPTSPAAAAPAPVPIAAIDRPAEKLTTYYAIKAAFAAAAFPVLLIALYFRYDAMGYRFDAEGIRMSWGVIFRREIILNYSRIQGIHLRSR